MARYHAKNAVVYMSTTGTGDATTVLAVKSWSLNSPTDRVEVTAFGDANKQYVQGLADITGELSAWWDDTDDNFYDASGSSDGVKLYLYPSSGVAGKYWYGPAWVDFNIAAGADQAWEITASFAANGAWGQV